MTPNMRRTWLLSALPTWSKLGRSSSTTGHAIRPERVFQGDQDASLLFRMVADVRVEGLSKVYLGRNMTGLGKWLQSFGAQHCRVNVYTKEPGRQYKLEPLWHDIVARIDRPNGNAYSLLQCLHGLTKEVADLWPSTYCALVSFHAASGKKWTLQCALPCNAPSEPVDNDPVFILQCEANLSEKKPMVGPRPANVTNIMRILSFDLYLRPRPDFVENKVDQSSNRKHANGHAISTAVQQLMGGLRQDVLHRTFTSNASLVEAAVQYLERSVCSSILSKYFQLKEIRTLGRGRRDRNSYIIWLHGRSGQEAAGLPNSVSKPGLLHEERDPQTRPPKTGKQKCSMIYASHRSTKCGNTIMSLAGPATADVSAIARRFESRYAESAHGDLSSIIEAFGAVLRETPPEHADSLLVRVSRDKDPERDHRPGTGNCTGLVKEPSRCIELKKHSSDDCLMISIPVEIQERFRIGFNKANWDDRPVEVKKLVFHMASVDVSPSMRAVSGEAPTTEQGIKHLATSALSILRKVCNGVRFEDVTTVPHMLAEALLRAVQPLTTSMKLEQVTLSIVIGDDPLIITTTITSEHLMALTSDTRYAQLPLVQVELPPYTNMNMRHLKSLSANNSNAVRKTGFQEAVVSVQVSSEAEYKVGKHAWDPVEALEIAWDALPASDLFNLQILTRAAVEENPGSESALLHLSTKRERNHDAKVSSYEGVRCRIRFADLSAGIGSVNQGNIVPVVISVWLKGSPVRQGDVVLCASQQITHMEETLMPRLRSNIQGVVFSDENDLAQVAADAVHSAKPDLAKHLFVESLEVETHLRVEEIPTGSDQNDDVATGVRGEHEFLTDDPDGHDSYLPNTESVGASTDGDDKAGQNHQVEASSTTVPGTTHATTLRRLIDELDAQLSSISPSCPAQDMATDTEPHTLPLDATIPPRRDMKRGVVVALGSNVGNRIEEIEKACRAIDQDPDMRIVDTSYLYETKPMYVEDQERFVNGACEIETSLRPLELLDRLQAIEQGHGRVKLIDKGPRNIDLDIAIFRDEVVDSERLTIPHMLMHEREFVLRPIMDLWDMHRWKNPRTKKPLQTMYKKIRRASKDDMYTTTPLTAGTFVHTSIPKRQTHIMSILNTTPDSFSDGGSNALDLQSLRETAAAHIAAGATIIDVGGQSSRPNAPDVTAEEEMNRVLPAIAAIKSLPEAKGIAISVDTYRAAVAEAAVNAGADIVNDISAGMMDPQMLPTVARLGCTYIMMHMRGTPATMQNPENCKYEFGLGVTVKYELKQRVKTAIQSGIRKWRLILDPGIGFAKTQEQNLALLSMDRKFCNTRRDNHRIDHIPWLVGSSRKGFIGKITGVTEPKDRVWGTAVAVTASIQGGADIVRVHDVKEMAQVVKMADALYRQNHSNNWEDQRVSKG